MLGIWQYAIMHTAMCKCIYTKRKRIKKKLNNFYCQTDFILRKTKKEKGKIV